MSNPTPLPQKFCAWCGEPLLRKRYGTQLEDRSVFMRRKFCDLKCFAEAKTSAEPSLAALRKRHQKNVQKGSTCANCGTKQLLGLHHFDGDPANNSPENVTTLCASCHTRWHWEHGKVPAQVSPPCRVCGKKSRGHSMCQKHWLRFKQYGDPLLTKRLGAGGQFYLVRVSPSE